MRERTKEKDMKGMEKDREKRARGRKREGD